MLQARHGREDKTPDRRRRPHRMIGQAGTAGGNVSGGNLAIREGHRDCRKAD
jgi:hypothetical protein